MLSGFTSSRDEISPWPVTEPILPFCRFSIQEFMTTVVETSNSSLHSAQTSASKPKGGGRIEMPLTHSALQTVQDSQHVSL